MKKLICIIFAATFVSLVACQQHDEDMPNYAALDRELTLAASYDNNKINTLNDLRQQFLTAGNAADAHRTCITLAREYRSFINDSALFYYQKAVELATRMGNRQLLTSDRLLLANQYIYSSYHHEAQLEMEKVRREDVDESSLQSYYTALCHLYQHVGNETEGNQRDQLHNRSAAYRDSICSITDPRSETYLRERCSQLCMEGRYEEADTVSQLWENAVSQYSRDYAVFAYYKSDIARALDRQNERRYWLVESAISDIRHSVKHQMALWMLAEMLAADGDKARPYKYVLHSWECAQLFNAQGLTWMISPVFTSINDNYNYRLNEINQRLYILIVAISLLMAGLAVSYVVVHRKSRQLAIARAQLAETNSQLEEFNTKLTTSNQQLAEANRLKEEYIGQFFSICSEYIDKLDKYRIKVNRKLKANQTAELLKMTASEQLRDDEQKELLANFDKIFSNIFPNFVERFNALLQPESRIHLPATGQTATTLRIFALIRLGIEESSRIAEFLNYPPGTIYNYRNRIKTKALCDRSEFEERVKSIGMD